MTATHRKWPAGRPAGAAETCRSGSRWERFPRFVGWESRSKVTRHISLSGPAGQQRGAATTATAGAGSAGGRGPSHGRVCGTAAAAGRRAGAGTGPGEKSPRPRGRRRRRGSGPHCKYELRGGGFQPLQVSYMTGRGQKRGEVTASRWSAVRRFSPLSSWQVTPPVSSSRVLFPNELGQVLVMVKRCSFSF